LRLIPEADIASFVSQGQLFERSKMPPITISALVSNFAGACRSLVPALDIARVPWREGQQYDNWDRLEEVLFESLVSEPCVHEALAAGETVRFGRYGFDARDEESNAQLVVHIDGESDGWRYVQLATVQQPFDAVRCVSNEKTRVFRIAYAQFRFVATISTGEITRDEVRLDH
jgi:hypothetical protein